MRYELSIVIDFNIKVPSVNSAQMALFLYKKCSLIHIPY